MGWANCGNDSLGRAIGYAHQATCDHPGCDAQIDRGLSYACGGMHGDCGGQACEKYFCTEHLRYVDKDALGLNELTEGQLCFACYESARDTLFEMVAAGDLKIVNNASTPPPPQEPSEKMFGCHAGRDGECSWAACPQMRDGEPTKSGRHCPRDIRCGDPSCDAVERANKALAAISRAKNEQAP